MPTDEELNKFKKEMLDKGFDEAAVDKVIEENKTQAAPPEQKPVSYQIKPGDTLSDIAKQSGTSIQELASTNQIADPNMIYAGDTLNIKTGKQEPKTDFANTQESTSSGRMVDTNVFKVNQAFGNYNPGLELTKSGINYGVDINANKGDKVSLPPGEEWEVIESYGGGGWNEGYGNSVKAKNRLTGETIRISHLKDVYTTPGEVIKGGSMIGTIGTTGNTTGPHADIEMQDPKGDYQDIMESRYGKYLY